MHTPKHPSTTRGFAWGTVLTLLAVSVAVNAAFFRGYLHNESPVKQFASEKQFLAAAGE